MAQTRMGGRGNAKDAPLAVPLTSNPDPDDFTDLVEYIRGRPNLVVRAKAGTLIRGYAPGDDEGELPRMLTIPVGGVARVVVDAHPAVQQDATVLASMVARGTLDIVAPENFNGSSPPHREIHAEIRQAQLARLDKRSGAGVGLQAEIAGLRAEVAELRAAAGGVAPKVAAAEAEAEPKTAAAKK